MSTDTFKFTEVDNLASHMWVDMDESTFNIQTDNDGLALDRDQARILMNLLNMFLSKEIT